MKRKLELASLKITSFDTSAAAAAAGGDTFDIGCKCCTGCDSGCGIFPTAGCENSGGGGDTVAPNC